MVRTVNLALMMACAFSMAAVTPAQVSTAESETGIIVFFDWSEPDINRDATEILDKVAAEFAAQPGSRLVLAGHSDRSGPAGANLRASKKRAAAVRDYLAAHGVSAGSIALQAFGEQRPIVATEDGVREVQNRRVEISFVAGR